MNITNQLLGTKLVFTNVILYSNSWCEMFVIKILVYKNYYSYPDAFIKYLFVDLEIKYI